MVPVPSRLDQLVARPVLVAGVVGVAVLVVALVGALLVGGPDAETAAPPQLGFVDRGNQSGVAFCRDGELSIRALPPADQSDFRPTVVFWENERGGWERLGDDLAPEGLTAVAGALVEQVGCLTMIEGPSDGQLCTWDGQGQVVVQDAVWRATIRRAIDGGSIGTPTDIMSTKGCSTAELTAAAGGTTIRPPTPSSEDLSAFLTPWVGSGEVDRIRAERAARERAWNLVAPACGTEHAVLPDFAPWEPGFGTLVAVAEANAGHPHSAEVTPVADVAIPDFWRADVETVLGAELVLCVGPVADAEVTLTPAVCPATPSADTETAPQVEVELLTQPVGVRLFAAQSGQTLFEGTYPASLEPTCPDPAVIGLPAEAGEPAGPQQIWRPSEVASVDLVEAIVGFVEG